MPCANVSMCRPDTLTTPIPPRPCAVAMAAMVSAFGNNTFIFTLGSPSDIPLLADGKHVVHNGIQNQPGREKEEDHTERDWHDLHNLGLYGVGWLRIKARLNNHAHPNNQRQNIIRIRRR